MDLTDWLVILAIALAAIAFFCSRGGHKIGSVDRVRHMQGTCLLMLGAVALWSALLMLQRSFIAPVSAPFGFALSPRTALAAALVLGAVGVVWSFRASRLLKGRRIFGAC